MLFKFILPSGIFKAYTDKYNGTTLYGDTFLYELHCTDFDWDSSITVTLKGTEEYFVVDFKSKNSRHYVEELISTDTTNYYQISNFIIVVDKVQPKMQQYTIEEIVRGEIDVPPEIVSKCEEILSTAITSSVAKTT